MRQGADGVWAMAIAMRWTGSRDGRWFFNLIVVSSRDGDWRWPGTIFW